MRLHRLEITAFGPFADTVEVDVDALADASLFLLCGEIGAGKTMVLDAVCFALYGDVPSDRGRAKQLRSHFAADGVAPRVVLEASLSGRRFRFTRSPAWVRPKKRGDGTTTAQASVLVEEHVDDAWLVRSTRLDEAGHLVSDLLGMTLAQFSQVVMLPQGRFDTFLRASSEERHALLTRLFRTRRFEDVERWLAERRTTLRRSNEARAGEVATLLHRMSENTGADLPTGDLLPVVEEGRVASWSDGLVAGSEIETGTAGRALTSATTRLEQAVAADAEGQRVAALQQRHTRAAVRRAQLDATARDAEAERRRLDAAVRSAAVEVPRLAAVAAAHDLATAEERSRDALAAVAELLSEHVSDDADPRALDAQARHATERAATAAAFVPRAEALVAEQERRGALAARVDELVGAQQELHRSAEEVPARVTALEATVAGLRERAGRVDLLKARLAEGGRRLSTYAVLTELEFQVTDFSAKRDAQQVVASTLKEHLLDVRERRLHGMAAELASAMAVGASCPVCGSHEHPEPAQASPGSPDRAEEQRLQSELDDAEGLLEVHRDQVRGYAGRLDVVREELGGVPVEEAEAAVRDVQTELVEATTAAAGLAEQQRELADLVAHREDLQQQKSAVDADLAVAREQLAACERAASALTEELAELLGAEATSHPATELAEWVSDLAARSSLTAERLGDARDALTEQDRRRELAAEATVRLEDQAREQGFADAADAAAHVLDAALAAELRTRVEDRARAEAETSATLDDPDVLAVAGLPRPDLATLTEVRERVTAVHAAAVAAADHAHRTRERLLAQAESLRALLTAWEPERAEYAVVRSLSELAEGKGPENPKQMRLSAYVLAARLGQVVAAANERLVRMTDDRYLLEHTADRGVGERRGGLSLLVRDQWTDELRDPVTLSGGETFVVSLALALGLSDVVTAEAGGARVDTLFVDEGFGSLDADTLDLVMDTLDGLREGGRTVGVVSHVPELRARIPAQLVVHKGRAGSRLEHVPGR